MPETETNIFRQAYRLLSIKNGRGMAEEEAGIITTAMILPMLEKLTEAANDRFEGKGVLRQAVFISRPRIIEPGEVRKWQM